MTYHNYPLFHGFHYLYHYYVGKQDICLTTKNVAVLMMTHHKLAVFYKVVLRIQNEGPVHWLQ